jgi:subtilisin family serine protease
MTYIDAEQAFAQQGHKPRSTETVRHYIALRATPELRRIYFSPNPTAILEYIAQWVFENRTAKRLPFSIADLPSQKTDSTIAALAAKSAPGGPAAGSEKVNPHVQPLSDELVVALNIDPKALETIRDAVAGDQGGEVFLRIGVDVPFAGADHWCPREAADPIFATRSAAERLLGVDYLRSQNGTSGQGVNVVIVDQGLDKRRLPHNYGGGWPAGGNQPGETQSPELGKTYPTHGMKIAHNILKIAPDVTLFDLPVVPPRITDIPAYLSQAEAAYIAMLAAIASGEYTGPWIVVNAWAIYDTTTDPGRDYVDNPLHSLNQLVDYTVSQGIDVVFGAGNCGQFCPDERCGGTDRGPGHSIWGANSLDKVLTVGAVRADAMWLGYSSQGPGQRKLGESKPDLCAPSQFCENDDAHIVNTGTSTACALAAGVVAALRSKWNATEIPPDELKKLLTETARNTDGTEWNNRLGYGILNAKAAYDKALATIPIPP